MAISTAIVTTRVEIISCLPRRERPASSVSLATAMDRAMWTPQTLICFGPFSGLPERHLISTMMPPLTATTSTNSANGSGFRCHNCGAARAEIELLVGQPQPTQIPLLFEEGYGEGPAFGTRARVLAFDNPQLHTRVLSVWQ